MTYAPRQRRRHRPPTAHQPDVVEMEPLVITGRPPDVVEMEPLEITASPPTVVEMEPLEITAGEPGTSEADGDSTDAFGLPLFLSARLSPTEEQAEPTAPAEEQLAEPGTEPAADQAEQPLAEQEAEPAADQAEQPLGEQDAEPAADLAAPGEPAAELPPAEEEDAQAPAAAPPAADGGAGPDELLRSWQSGLRQATTAVPTPSLGAAGQAHSGIAAAGRSAGAAQARRRQEIPQSGGAVVPPAPQVPAPPAPPPDNPIPEQTRRIEDASSGPGRRLPERSFSALVTRPGGTPPRLGTTAISPRIFQLLTNPSRLTAAQVSSDANDPDRRQLDAAVRAFEAPIEPAPAQGPAAPVTVQDQGAPPIEPLPPGQGEDVGRVVARLLAEPEAATERVLRLLKRNAFPQAVLLGESFTALGQAMLPALQTTLSDELRRVAAAAGVSEQQLTTMVGERRTELEQQRIQASIDTSQASSEANACVAQEGGQTLGTIGAVRDQINAETLRRQEAASGGTDPSVIEARRRQIADWVRERVTTETTNFKRQGDARDQALDEAIRQRENAYTFAAQRDEYTLLNTPAPVAQRPADEQRRAQDEALLVRNFARDQIQLMRTEIDRFKRADRDTVSGWRTAVENAGTDAIRAAREWSDRRIDEGRSWWDSIVARVRGWHERAQEETIRWEARTTEDTRNMIAGDLQYITQLEQQVRDGATRESLLANDRLSAEQRAIVEAYFAPNASRNRLDMVAARLETRLASQQQTQAKSGFENELLAESTDWHALNLVGAAERPGFSAGTVASQVHDAVAGWGTNEAQIYSNLTGLTKIQIAAVRRNYRARYGETLDAALEGDLSDDELTRAQMQLQGDQRAADAYALHYAVDQWGTDEETIMNVLRNQTPEQRAQIVAYYNEHFDPDLDAALRDDMSGHERDQATALMHGNLAEADAIALDESMRGSFWGWGAGTDEAQIESTYTRIRSEVLAQAQREGWTSAQMEAEVRRRNREVETAFNRRYADVAEYRVPGHENESVLRQAFRSELSGPELDLANALQDNDLARADAARIEIERQGFYADDEKINGVLRSQYERSLEGVRLDEGPERREQVRRQLERWAREHPNASPNDLSREQMRLEREMERAMEGNAQQRSRLAMSQLEQVYSDQYNGRSLRITLAMNMSGDELARARLLVRQGGHLTPYQELDFATRDVGTDEARLRQALQGRTRAEIQQIRAEWERNHPGQNFDSFLRGELSGRDEFEIMDTVEHGAPESAQERADELRRQHDYELNHGAWISVADAEANYLRGEMATLEQNAQRLNQTGLSDEDRERILFEFNTQADLTNDAVQDHHRAVERITETATQVVGLVAAVVVGTLATVLSGGALGPVAVALIGSVASTLSTMATKFVLQGADYGIEDVGVDLAVGVVDALAAVATAGIGSAVMGRFLGTAGGAAARAGEGAAVRAAVSSGGNRASQALQRLGSRIARSAPVARLNQFRVVNRAGQAISRFATAQEGSLTRAVRGAGVEAVEAQAAYAARLRAMSSTQRVLTELMAETIDNTIQSAPSAFAASVINDDNWHGNIILNILSSTGQQVGQGLVLSGAMHGAKLTGSGLRGLGGMAAEHWRTRTPEGRLAEGSRRMGRAYVDYVAEHPDASYHDFANSPQGQRLRTELAGQGMLPTPRDIEAGLPASRATGEATPGPRVSEGDPAARPDARPEAPAPGEAGRAGAHPDAEAQTRAAADAETRTAPPETGPGRAPGDPAHRAAGEGEAAPARSGDPEAEALSQGLPERMRQSVPVEIKPDLPPGEVRVVPVREGGRVVGVRIEAGRGATPTDIMLHAHVVQGYQRYMGLLGRARELVERFHAWFNLQEHAGSGSAAFEARLEIEKLPALIEQRMAQLEGGRLDPAAQARLLDDINSLHAQIQHHTTRLNDMGAGRGYVAAEGIPQATNMRGSDADVQAGYQRHLSTDSATLRQSIDALGQRQQAALSEHTAESNKLPELEGELANARRNQERQQQSVANAEQRIANAQEALNQARSAPDSAESNSVKTAERELRNATTQHKNALARLAEADQAVNTAEKPVQQQRQRVAEAEQRFLAESAELTGALEAQQSHLIREMTDLDQRIREIQTQRDAELAALDRNDGPEIAAQRQRIDELEIRLEELDPADVVQQRRLTLELEKQKEALRRLQETQRSSRAQQATPIQARAQQSINELRHQIAARERELREVQSRTLDIGRSRSWQTQGFYHLGRPGVVPCFPGDTIVKTPQGDRPIAELREGDHVYAYDFVMRRLISRPVRFVWRNWTQALAALSVGGETLHATAGHPFWEETEGGWLRASDLRPNCHVRTIDQRILPIHTTDALAVEVATYNLEIESAHTFFVGKGGILVHNADTGSTSKFMRTRRRPTTIYVIYDTRQTPAVPIYVGKTHQSLDGATRLKQHLRDALESEDTEINRKQEWLRLAEQGHLEMRPEKSGSWTEFETAVWEQHIMAQYGGPDVTDNLNHSTLQNRRNEITPETYREYKNMDLVDEQGRPFRHNPCQ
ncbi:MAG TPA: polymorphic toxin-type HINT domain-containing protein [Roseiflexaceae bacterium]|nr:polymorphic toxin-type HINT domain-containing protein [Roseiflexaceae bacterium]